MKKMSKEQITSERIPLEVREHLMRGEQDAAISLLVSEYSFYKDEANQLINDYREALRARKVSLEVQIMHDKQAKEEREEKHIYWVWGARIALLITVLCLLYLLASPPR